MSGRNTGGSAFPMQDPQAIHAYAAARVVDVQDANERDRIYMAARAEAVGGMTLRDHFACQALAGLLANPAGPVQENGRSGWGYVNCTEAQIAETAYSLADEMLKARDA